MQRTGKLSHCLLVALLPHVLTPEAGHALKVIQVELIRTDEELISLRTG
jgi:hypothetical protein